VFHLLLDTESENEMRADGRIEVWSIDTVQKKGCSKQSKGPKIER